MGMIDRLLQPLVSLLPAEVAAKVADVRVDEATSQRVDYLADRATEGTLSDEERAEYAGYIQAIDVIAALQVNARFRSAGQ